MRLLFFHHSCKFYRVSSTDNPLPVLAIVFAWQVKTIIAGTINQLGSLAA
jgi:UV DNA damage repair endonuclease